MRLTRPGARDRRDPRPYLSVNARKAAAPSIKTRLHLLASRGSRRRRPAGSLAGLLENLLELLGLGLRLAVVGHQAVYLLLDVRELRVAVAGPRPVRDYGFD